MALGVITNVQSLNSQRSLMSSQGVLQTAMARLSSGLRINSAKDDAAGLGISDRMTAQITGMNQAIRNANDGISLAQTAEGAMQESTTLLQRIRVLSVQSANDTNTAQDRTALNDEVQQLLAEMERISQTTQFNGQNIIDGSYTGAQFQVGANSAQTITVNVGDVRTSVLGSYQAQNVTAVTNSSLAAGELTVNGVAVGASTSSSAEAKAAALNAVSNLSNVYATATTTLESANTLKRGQSLQSGDLVLNGVNVGGVAGSNNVATQGSNVAAAINAVSNQTGVTAEANNVTGALTLTSSTGKDIKIESNNGDAGYGRIENATGLEVSTSTVQAAKTYALGAATAGTNTLTLTSVAGNTETVTIQGTTFTFAAAAAGTTTVAFGGNETDSATNLFNAISAAITAGTLKNITATNATDGEIVLTSTAATSTTTYTAITETLANGAAVAAGSAGVAAGATLTLGGKNYEFVFSAADAVSGNVAVVLGASHTANATALNAAINAQYAAGNTNIQSTNLVAASIVVTSDLIGTSGDATVLDATLPATITNTATTAGVDAAGATTTTTGTLSLDSAKTFTVAGSGLAKMGLAGSTAALVALNTADISTVDGANLAIKLADGALSQIDTARAYLGAVQNRFDSVVKNLASSSENLSAARSRIRDADFAAETAESSKQQILQQSGIAMLVQANQVQQLVLSLLR